MFNWFLVRLKWLGLLGVLANFAVPAFVWYETETDNLFAEKGIDAVAKIDGGSRKTGRRSGEKIQLNLVWNDKGQPRRAEEVTIPKSVVNRIIVNDRIMADTIPIRYIPDEPDRAPRVVDGPQRPKIDAVLASLTWFGYMLPAGLVGFAMFYFLRNRA